jgi:chaperone modulatory protein CbpM
MIMHKQELALEARIDDEQIEKWVAAGWLIPHGNGEQRDYSEVDLARVRLIRDLHTLGVNDEGIPIVLDLIDQLHGLRRALRHLLTAISAQETGPHRS